MKLIEDYESAKREILEKRREKARKIDKLEEPAKTAQGGKLKKLTKKEVKGIEKSMERRKSLQGILMQEAERKSLISDIEQMDDSSAASHVAPPGESAMSSKEKSEAFKKMAAEDSKPVEEKPPVAEDASENDAPEASDETSNPADKAESSHDQAPQEDQEERGQKSPDSISTDENQQEQQPDSETQEDLSSDKEKEGLSNSDDSATGSAPRTLDLSEIVDETDKKVEPAYTLDIGVAEVEGESIEFPIIESEKTIETIVISSDGDSHALFVNDERVAMGNRWFHCLLGYVEEIEEDDNLDIKLQFNENGGIANVDMPEIRVCVRSYAVVIVGDNKPVRRLVEFKS